MTQSKVPSEMGDYPTLNSILVLIIQASRNPGWLHPSVPVALLCVTSTTGAKPRP